MNLGEARKLAQMALDAETPRISYENSLARTVLELADEVERLREQLSTLADAADNTVQPEYVQFQIECAYELLKEDK